jgi:asparagine synthase (glutamine-hydrolysing)
MCAIAGDCAWSGVATNDDVTRLVERMRHRGPDDAGVWRSPSGRCVLGHARLSILDLSAAGHQPMVDPLTGNAIVFNGEIYNFEQHRSECVAAGDRFLSHTDTEVILALYRRHGIHCLRRLRGMFAFALWDEPKQELVLARDRLGKKPLHYALGPARIAFASELDPLARHPAVSRDLDEEALALYLQLQYIPAPWTIYRSIRKLPPGHFARWNADGFHVQEYWSVDYTEKVRLDEPEALERLDEQLREAVRLRLVSDVPLGALLSGGVDSSLIVALMAQVSHRTVKTYSVGFQEQAYNELPYAEAIARQYGTDHQSELIDGRQEPVLHQIIRHHGEPYADPSAIPSYYVCRFAREHVTVVMNGDGGDELLSGYPRYSLASWQMATARVLAGTTKPDRLAQVATQLNAAGTFPARVRRKMLLGLVHPELRAMSVQRAYWSDSAAAQLMPQSRISPASVLHSWRAEWLRKAVAAADDPIDRMLWLDNHTYLPGDLLAKMDIASMQCSLEARSPLLDHEVIEFCARLPAALKVKGATGKYLLKKLAERYVPRKLLYRPKMGFDVPLARWLRGPLRKLMDESLRDPHLISPLDHSMVEHTLREFDAGAEDHTSRLWSVLMFALWKQACC